MNWITRSRAAQSEVAMWEKLQEHFNGREDVAVRGLGIDDDPMALDPALKELRGALPSVAARNCAYDRVPCGFAGQPDHTASQSGMFDGLSGSLEAWLEQATKGCEKATSQ